MTPPGFLYLFFIYYNLSIPILQTPPSTGNSIFLHHLLYYLKLPSLTFLLLQCLSQLPPLPFLCFAYHFLTLSIGFAICLLTLLDFHRLIFASRFASFFSLDLFHLHI